MHRIEMQPIKMQLVIRPDREFSVNDPKSKELIIALQSFDIGKMKRLLSVNPAVPNISIISKLVNKSLENYCTTHKLEQKFAKEISPKWVKIIKLLLLHGAKLESEPEGVGKAGAHCTYHPEEYFCRQVNRAILSIIQDAEEIMPGFFNDELMISEGIMYKKGISSQRYSDKLHYTEKKAELLDRAIGFIRDDYKKSGKANHHFPTQCNSYIQTMNELEKTQGYFCAIQ